MALTGTTLDYTLHHAGLFSYLEINGRRAGDVGAIAINLLPANRQPISVIVSPACLLGRVADRLAYLPTVPTGAPIRIEGRLEEGNHALLEALRARAEAGVLPEQPLIGLTVGPTAVASGLFLGGSLVRGIRQVGMQLDPMTRRAKLNVEVYARQQGAAAFAGSGWIEQVADFSIPLRMGQSAENQALLQMVRERAAPLGGV